MLTGAAAAGYLNRKATLDIGGRLVSDLGLDGRAGPGTNGRPRSLDR
jgi:hypothetical protein